VTVLGVMSASFAIATAGTAAFNAYQADSVSHSQPSSSEGAHSDTKVQAEIIVPPEPAQTEYHESVSTSPDQQTETRHYSAASQDENGNVSSQNHTITTDIDGNTAVDVSLDTNSSTSGSSSTNSSVNLNVNSSSSTHIHSSSGP
jgi:hypothetical protein